LLLEVYLGSAPRLETPTGRPKMGEP